MNVPASDVPLRILSTLQVSARSALKEPILTGSRRAVKSATNRAKPAQTPAPAIHVTTGRASTRTWPLSATACASNASPTNSLSGTSASHVQKIARFVRPKISVKYARPASTWPRESASTFLARKDHSWKLASASLAVLGARPAPTLLHAALVLSISAEALCTRNPHSVSNVPAATT